VGPRPSPAASIDDRRPTTDEEATVPTRSHPEPPTAADLPSLTLALGTVTRDPDRRDLPSGGAVLSFDLSVRAEGCTAESVPVAWPDPPARAALAAGAEVLVLGRTRRRFFRSAGTTASRTEIVAERVVPLRQQARCAAALDEAADRLAVIAEPVEG
jgi:hypothetical protein